MDHDAHLSAIVAGDAAAFALWLAGCEPRLRGSLRPFAAHADVEAILQEALLRIWQVAPRHRPDGRPDSLLRLGVRIARNLVIDELRRARVSAADAVDLERALAEEAVLIGSGVPDPLLRRAIAECQGRLPRKLADALGARLASAGAEPDETLATRLGMKLNTFLQNFTRARKFLAECLGKKKIHVEQELSR